MAEAHARSVLRDVGDHVRSALTYSRFVIVEAPVASALVDRRLSATRRCSLRDVRALAELLVHDRTAVGALLVDVGIALLALVHRRGIAVAALGNDRGAVRRSVLADMTSP